MTDYTELRRLAERYEDTVDDIDAHLEAVQDYRDATRPSTVLALLDEVERCHKRLHSPYAADARAEADTYAEAVVKAIARAEKAEATIATQAKEIELWKGRAHEAADTAQKNLQSFWDETGVRAKAEATIAEQAKEIERLRSYIRQTAPSKSEAKRVITLLGDDR